MGEAMSGLLGDIYSTIDSKKRQLKGLLADPVETLKLGLLNFKNDQNALLDTQSTAYPWTGAYQQNPTPQQQAAAQKQLADQGANMGIAAATVWHGSPHKFDKFDSSKIGTGEGAQAYGHGLYLAESPDVAKSYMGPGTSIGGPAFENKLSSLMEKAQDAGRYGEAGALEELLINRNPAMARSKFSVSNGYSPETVAQAHGIIQKYENKFQPAGLYKVDLPDEAIAKMLDWDSALYKNHQSVQDALGSIGYVTTPPRGMVKGKSLKGGAIYEDMVRNGMNPSEISEKLESLGIPGIRYLDGGSRGAGSGTSNYVIFPGNEDLLTILERNGQGLLGQ